MKEKNDTNCAGNKKRRTNLLTAAVVGTIVLFMGLWLFGLTGLLTCVKTDAANRTDNAPKKQAHATMVDGTWYEPVSIQLKRPDGTVIKGDDWTIGQTLRTGETRVVIDGKLYVTHVSNILMEYEQKP